MTVTEPALETVHGYGEGMWHRSPAFRRTLKPVAGQGKEVVPMIWNLASFTAIALAGLAGPQDPVPGVSGADTPDRISYAGTGNGWTGGRTEWWIDRSGRGSYRTTIRQPMDGSFDAGPRGFERIRAILQPLESMRELPCDGAVTDQGGGVLNWRRAGRETILRFDFGCNFRQPDAARERLGEASEQVKDWARSK